MAFGRLKVDQIETSTQIVNVDDLTASNGISDGDKGDITVASGGTVWLVNNQAVSYNELADLPSFTGPVIAGRESGTGALQGLTLGTGLSISSGVLSATVSGGAGGVTSVGFIAPSGFAVAGSPVTSSGSITLSFAAGYSLPTTASQANWDTAYSERLYWNGGATGLNAVTARASLGLGNSATLNIGTTAGTVAAGDALSVHVAAADPHPNYALESSLGGAALLNVGTTSGTVAAGDDNRFVPSGGTTGQVLTKTSGTDYDASWQDITTAIDDLTDVTITSVADGEVLTYDSATSQWINATPTGGGGTPGGTTGQLQWNSSGSFAGVGSSTVGATGDITLSLNGAADTPPLKLTGTWFTGGTSTTTKPQLLIEPTGTTSTAWSTSGTGLGINAPSTFAGDLLHLQQNGISRARITRFGVVEATGQSYNLAAFKFKDRNSGITHWNQGHVGIIRENVHGLLFDGTNHVLGSLQTFAWGNNTYPGLGEIDLFLHRDAAGALAQRNSANAQTFRCYGTYTDASNYVRAALSSTSTAVTLAAETAGTGADDIPLNLTAAGTGTVKINSVAEVASSSTVAGLPTSPVVGMITRVTDASFPTLGATVSGGGAAAALVWYNGANWTVLGV